MREADLKAIIVDGDAEVLVRQAEALGRQLARPLTTSQIRNVFGTVRRIEMKWPDAAGDEPAGAAYRDLVLLKPKLAYQEKRERGKGQGVKMLREVLDPAIDLVQGKRDRFQNFVDFFEAILAYHKAHGGK
jgi:CRISPR-associated protein Csm2